MEDNLIFDKFGIDSETNEKILVELSNAVEEFILNRRTGPILDELKNSHLGPNCPKFISRDFYEDPERRKHYDLGMLHMLFRIYWRTKDKYEKERQDLEILKHKHVSSFICFLYKNSNVTHAQICKHMKVSPSTLTKFLSEFQQYHYFVSRRIGRHNIYNINFNGRRLYSSIMKMREMAEIYIRMQ